MAGNLHMTDFILKIIYLQAEVGRHAFALDVPAGQLLCSFAQSALALSFLYAIWNEITSVCDPDSLHRHNNNNNYIFCIRNSKSLAILLQN